MSSRNARRVVRVGTVAVAMLLAYGILERVARADDPNWGCCKSSDACTGCKPCGSGLYADVGTTAWKTCTMKLGDPSTARCYPEVPGIVFGEPKGYCLYKTDAQRFSTVSCTTKDSIGLAIVGPSYCSAEGGSSMCDTKQ